MINVRWMKPLRDLWMARGRVAAMVVALAASLFGLGAVLGAYTILTREIEQNYANTHPAMATFDVDGFESALVDRVEALPGVSKAELRGSVLARVQIQGGDWAPLRLFVVRDFDNMKMSTFWHEAGDWPPPTGGLLLERTVLPLFHLKIGDRIEVRGPSGHQASFSLAGTVHDPALAPAWQERQGYGYITPEALTALGEPGSLDQLKVVWSKDSSGGTLDEKAQKVVTELKAWGVAVHGVAIPPPGKHPHQNQMIAILMVLLVFSLLTLVLSSILTATMVAGLMAKEVKQIGVLKTIGGGTGQIASLYIAQVFVICALALAGSVPLGTWAATGLSIAVSELLNFTLYSTSIPIEVLAIQLAAGFVIPLALALIPIVKTARQSVRQAISHSGTDQERYPEKPSPIWTKLFGILGRTFLLTMRNAFRKKGRLLLTLGLLAAGGGMFMTALNVKSAWDRNLDEAFAARRFDFEIRLAKPEAAGPILEALKLSGIRTVEPWSYAPTSRSRSGIEISRTYPDGGHGSFSLRGVPERTEAVKFPLLAGRWLVPGDRNQVVLNQLAKAQFPEKALGDDIDLTVEGVTTTWKLTGIVQEIGPATAYVDDRAFRSTLNMGERVQAYRVISDSQMRDAKIKLLKEIESKLSAQGISVSLLIADSEFRNAVADHIAILIFALLSMAALMALVGLLGLASAIGTSIVERTRELGVMRVLGGTPGNIVRNLIAEAILIGALSLLAAVPFSIPLSLMLGFILGQLAFATPLPFIFSFEGLAIWTGILLTGSFLASLLPALRAARMPVRETLVTE